MEHDASPVALELRGIYKQFAQHAVLDGIDLSVGRGEVFVLVGPSGSGKSTALKMVSGIDTPDRGEVWLAGENVTHLPANRRAVNTVFQNYALFPHLNVTENVAFPLAVAGVSRGEQRRRVAEALDWVQLGIHARRRIAMLSGGEKQRVALARALVNEPRCLLLDEPLSALDPHLRAATLELLQDVQMRRGMTYLYITHDREEALRIATRIGVLNRGRLEQVGTPEQIYAQPRTAFVASFLGRINWLHGRREPGNRNALRLSSGELVPLSPAANLDAADLKLGLRPEQLQLGGEGFLQARVVARQYAGHSLHVRLATADGTSLVADVRLPLAPHDPQSPPVENLESGQTIGVRWPPAAAHVFPAEAEEARE